MRRPASPLHLSGREEKVGAFRTHLLNLEIPLATPFLIANSSYIDVLEGRLFELESALLQVLPLVSNEQLDEITASIPPVPSRPHFRARFSQPVDTSGGEASSPQNLVAAPPPAEIVFHQGRQQQPRQGGRLRQHQPSQLVISTGDGQRSFPLQHNQQDPKQMLSSPWQQQHHHHHHDGHLPPSPPELGPFNEGLWPLPPPLLIPGDPTSASRQHDHHHHHHHPFLASPTRHSFGGGGLAHSSEFDFMPEFDQTTCGSSGTSSAGGCARETIMVSARGF
ncbi:hypothetical protein AYO22_05799 [Fonsecaea multimorphosa]|nr:hypothetical protein AYO22_05799 [Fonsecaea multimorphosa]